MKYPLNYMTTTTTSNRTAPHYYSPIGTEMGILRRPIERENLPRSVFGHEAHESRTRKYSVVPTIDILDILAEEGWFPVAATENSRSKNKGFQRHEVRLAREDGIRSLKVGDELTEAVLTNSLDGTTKFTLNFGLYRPVCANGMIVCEALFGGVQFKHMGLDINEVVDAVVNTTFTAPAVAGRVEAFKSTYLDVDDRRRFATEARNIRFGETSEFDPQILLEARREADKGDDLWSVFNRVQENAIKGGIKDYTLKKTRRTRPLANITQNQKVNKALFELADDFAGKLN